MTIPGSPPSDLELMLYADGELEGERLTAVEAWLERSEERAPHAKLAALGLVSRVVREHALDTASRADDLADSIMDLIDREVPLPEAPKPPARPITVPPARPELPKPPARPVANDNARSLFFVAAAVVAAAAAALLWFRPAPGPAAMHRKLGVTMEQTVSSARLPEADLEHGVEVSSVDFGATTGAVFYVPNGTSPSDTTTLVWLADNADGEDE